MEISQYVPVALDAFLAVIVLLFVARGRRMGFIKTLLSTVGTVVAAVVARAASSPIGTWIYEVFAKQALVDTIKEKLDATSKAGVEALMAAVPDNIAAIAESESVDIRSLFANIGVAGLNSREIAEKVTEAVLEPILLPVFSLLAFAGVMMLFSALLSLFLTGLNIFRKENSVLGTADRLTGMLFGLIKGAVVACAAALLLSAWASLSSGSAIAEAVAESRLIPAITSFVKNAFGGL